MELVEWDHKVVLDQMTGCRDSQVIPWTRAREILYVVNFKDMHWFTFRVDLQDWTITVLDCQKDIMCMQHNSVDFNTMMEVSKILNTLLNFIFIILHYYNIIMLM